MANVSNRGENLPATQPGSESRALILSKSLLRVLGTAPKTVGLFRADEIRKIKLQSFSVMRWQVKSAEFKKSELKFIIHD